MIAVFIEHTPNPRKMESAMGWGLLADRRWKKGQRVDVYYRGGHHKIAEMVRRMEVAPRHIVFWREYPWMRGRTHQIRCPYLRRRIVKIEIREETSPGLPLGVISLGRRG